MIKFNNIRTFFFKYSVRSFKFALSDSKEILRYCEVMKLADMPSCLGGGVRR